MTSGYNAFKDDDIKPVSGDERYMREALKEAQSAFEEEEVPIGAVVVWNGRIIARGHNMTERLHDPSAHAEMIALTAATEAMGGKYLDECTLYVTVEPCPMCAGAMNWAQVGRVVYGAADPKRGFTKLDVRFGITWSAGTFHRDVSRRDDSAFQFGRALHRGAGGDEGSHRVPGSRNCRQLARERCDLLDRLDWPMGVD